MDGYRKIKNKGWPKIILCEDWFVRDKKISFGPARNRNNTRFDTGANERTLDKPVVKTVIWDGA